MLTEATDLRADKALPKDLAQLARKKSRAMSRLPKGQGTGARAEKLSTATANGILPQSHLVHAVAVTQRLIELRRQYVDMVKARVKLQLQVKAICRRALLAAEPNADLSTKAKRARFLTRAYAALKTSPVLQAMCQPLLEAQKPVTLAAERTRKDMESLTAESPLVPFAKSIKGFGVGGLATVLSEAKGNIGLFSTHSKLWAWFGVAAGQRRRKGEKAGYSIYRRSTLWVVGTNLIRCRQQNRYQAIYNERKALETERGFAKGHAHMRAHRYMEKRLLRDLWLENEKLAGHSMPAERPTIACPQDTITGHVFDAERPNDICP